MPFRADDFTVRFDNGTGIHNLFKLIFLADGTLAVAFPYFPQCPGLVSRCVLRAGQHYPMNLDLTLGGKVTSHLVKYSHHRSGEALFSQTGKVLTQVRKPSVPLNSYTGHLFTIQLQGVEHFAAATRQAPDPYLNAEDRPPKKCALTVKGTLQESQALKLVVNSYGKRDLKRIVAGPVIGPVLTVRKKQGEKEGMLISARSGNPASSSFLVLNWNAIPELTEEPGPHLSFIGGFDSPGVARDHTRDTSFLALMYPADDVEQLRQRIGSIDYAST